MNRVFKGNFIKLNFLAKRAVKPLELVHSDVCGKLKNKSLSSSEYFLTFIDDRTHFTWVYMLKKKGDVFQKFKEWRAMESGHRLKTLQWR